MNPRISLMIIATVIDVLIIQIDDKKWKNKQEKRWCENISKKYKNIEKNKKNVVK